ncbi:uncharacterized protein LOC113211525 isoform X2 [Frankliniella occidentalis]|uniref:Uncharacterized protein LOC113211525 isoform X2 n=1 Tax=Frankliniella occidentalis TaxID=133901 RepID=A0A9C6WUD1_FRAOC|nr:uncharacterized protein LOC113211525 isoform X2 [Frankliniella occidentalis]
MSCTTPMCHHGVVVPCCHPRHYRLSNSYEKVVQLDAVTPIGDTGLYPAGLAATNPLPPQPPPPQQPQQPQPSQQQQQQQQQQQHQPQPQASAGPPPPLQPPPAPAPRPGHHATHHYDNRAMQYYRLWIYTCNGLLLVCVLGFAVVACHTVVFDSRRSLVPGLSLLQPTFLYGYLAVLSQSGFIQMIGCLGARRLNQKLLNVYWLLLFLLLFGDGMVGIVWLFRFESICEELRPWLRQRLLQEYGGDPYFTTTWDAYQRDNRCCGVQGPADYSALNRSYGWLPESCCRVPPPHLYPQPPRSAALRNFHHYGTTTSTPSTTTVGLDDEYHILSALPEGDGRPGVVLDAADLYCGGELPPPPPPETPPLPGPGGGGASSTVSSSSVGSGGASTGGLGGGFGGGGVLSGGGPVVPTGGGRIITHTVLRPTPPPPPRYYRTGCEERLLVWLKSAADMLFIVGYCILGFVKVCFLGILRYEIKEMIQKIRMLQGDLTAPQLSSPDQDPQGRKTPPPGPQAQQARFSNNNGSLVTGRGPQQDDSPVIGSSRTPQERRGRADSGTTPLLMQPGESLQTTPLHQNPPPPTTSMSMKASSSDGPVQLQHTPMLHQRHHHHHLSLQDGGQDDSDTNSHCALLISDETAGPGGGLAGGGPGEGGGKVTRQGSNGNNNYELHELHDINRVLLARNRHRTDI